MTKGGGSDKAKKLLTKTSVQRPAKLHRLKTWPEPFDAVWSGEKHHEIRVDDRDYRVGDHLLLRRWDPEISKYTGRSIKVAVTYKSRGGTWGLPNSLCVLSIQHMNTHNGEHCCVMKKMKKDPPWVADRKSK